MHFDSWLPVFLMPGSFKESDATFTHPSEEANDEYCTVVAATFPLPEDSCIHCTPDNLPSRSTAQELLKNLMFYISRPNRVKRLHHCPKLRRRSRHRSDLQKTLPIVVRQDEVDDVNTANNLKITTIQEIGVDPGMRLGFPRCGRQIRKFFRMNG